MIREKLVQREIGARADFRWRSHEISRIEGLSDAVFAFAVTLLVVSLEVPKTFALDCERNNHGQTAESIGKACCQ
jgi:hypothetical protein